MFELEANKAFRRMLTRWYVSHGRHGLPWRLTREPYAVLVSEVMLQQTRVERVLPYWTAWMERWPTVASLAEASHADVLRAWSGLGYNRRAVALRQAAMAAVAGRGEIPGELNELQSLRGIGPYTASAVACFGYGRRVPVVDTNIARVLARALLAVETGRGAGPSAIAAAAQLILPARQARDHNLALMDLGAMVCTARAPRCDECPLWRVCAWRAAGSPHDESPAGHSTPPFESTARFARGRIVDALRRAETSTTDELTGMLPEPHRPHAARYLEALVRDGVVESARDGWRLPL